MDTSSLRKLKNPWKICLATPIGIFVTIFALIYWYCAFTLKFSNVTHIVSGLIYWIIISCIVCLYLIYSNWYEKYKFSYYRTNRISYYLEKTEQLLEKINFENINSINVEDKKLLLSSLNAIYYDLIAEDLHPISQFVQWIINRILIIDNPDLAFVEDLKIYFREKKDQIISDTEIDLQEKIDALGSVLDSGRCFTLKKS